jgi:hypothetical protein
MRDTPCCNGNCRQGRDCPVRLRQRSTREQAVSILLCALLLAVVLLLTWGLR